MAPATRAPIMVMDIAREPPFADLPGWEPTGRRSTAPGRRTNAVRRSRRETGERDAPRVERRAGRRHLVADVEVHADVARRPLREALGEPLRGARACAA